MSPIATTSFPHAPAKMQPETPITSENSAPVQTDTVSPSAITRSVHPSRLAAPFGSSTIAAIATSAVPAAT